MKYQIERGIHIQFAHHVRGHSGSCISLHGHTWYFEVQLGANELDKEGFVTDFGRLRNELLQPVYALLDHSVALGEQTWLETKEELAALGTKLVASRIDIHGSLGERQPGAESPIAKARNEWPGGIKISVFPFPPTSERLAEWLCEAAQSLFEDKRVKVMRTRVWETLHPVPSIAEFHPA